MISIIKKPLSRRMVFAGVATVAVAPLAFTGCSSPKATSE